MKRFNKSQSKILTESKLRKLIREEISCNTQYKNLSAQQKMMLEEGVLQNIASSIKGFFSKIFGKKGVKLTPDQEKSALEALKAACNQFIQDLEKLKNDSISINNQQIALRKQKQEIIQRFGDVNAKYRQYYEKYQLDDNLMKKLGAAIKGETDASQALMANLRQSSDTVESFTRELDPLLSALRNLLNVADS